MIYLRIPNRRSESFSRQDTPSEPLFRAVDTVIDLAVFICAVFRQLLAEGVPGRIVIDVFLSGDELGQFDVAVGGDIVHDFRGAGALVRGQLRGDLGADAAGHFVHMEKVHLFLIVRKEAAVEIALVCIAVEAHQAGGTGEVTVAVQFGILQEFAFVGDGKAPNCHRVPPP